MQHFSRYPLILFVLLGALFVCAARAHAADTGTVAAVLNAPPKQDLGITTQCAVCGMKLHVKSDTPGVQYKGRDYYFCDGGERDAFAQDPDKYLKK
jgi:YHS domain-containing protein